MTGTLSIYAVLIAFCYLSMIIYRELFARKRMTVWHAVIPSGISLVIGAAYTLFGGTNIFSPWIYPSWFFSLLGSIVTYLMLMVPMFFGAVYLDVRRKAWSAMIFPSALAVFIIIWLRGALFYEMGWLVFFMILFYLIWGFACVLTPRLVWTEYIKIRDKLGGRMLFIIVAGITAAAFAVAVFTIIFTIAANIGKAEADYIPPPLLTTEPSTKADIESTVQ